MKRKLTTIERLIDGNLTYRLVITGTLPVERLRTSLDRVQRKHPALRMLMREERDGLYYELDVAGPVPLRTATCTTEQDVAREIEREESAAFTLDEPQLRVAWLRTDHGGLLLITAAHRICDGMSVLIVAKELLSGLHREQPLLPYAPVSPLDIAGKSRSSAERKRRLVAAAINGLVSLVPPSRQALRRDPVRREWHADAALTSILKHRCRREQVSMHAALLAILDQALQAALGKRVPTRIDSPVDARRGRLSLLKDDTLFFGGGSFKIAVGRERGADLWARARDIYREMGEKIEQELQDIPDKYRFCEMLKPPSDGKVRSIVRLGDALSRNGNWNQFSFSNLGSIELLEPDAPFHLEEFSLSVRSFGVRVLGILAFSLHGRLRFVYVGEEQCMSLDEVDALERVFMELLREQVTRGERAVEPAGMLEVASE
ncbi:Condensation domain-containing protein [Dyella sp. OK004]|uniref:condensation domain-containing protein n=1 Tax=Dyella sp. OK004 TaxID=1855292 RepID=UPI0008EDEB5C|nr:condensation domain-containing protein [Dyella sp. OK004]SFR90428.1 Condensation domain-containing protein [Dyella sp. OK004]